MSFLLYFLNAGCSAAQSAFGKQYASKGGSITVFNFNKALAGFAIFLIFGAFSGLSLHNPTLLYGLAYGVFLSISMSAGQKALAMGPLSLTSIIASFSLIIPFVFGITVFDEKLTVFGIVGIILLLLSIVLLNMRKESGVSAKWSFFAFLTLFANGICSLIQKYHQIYFPSLYRTEFMLCATFTVAIILLVPKLSRRNSEKVKMKFSLLGILSGVFNGLANFIVLYLAATENASVLFPMVSALKVAAVWLVGRIAFREKLKVWQIIGLLLGTASVILLNL